MRLTGIDQELTLNALQKKLIDELDVLFLLYVSL